MTSIKFRIVVTSWEGWGQGVRRYTEIDFRWAVDYCVAKNEWIHECWPLMIMTVCHEPSIMLLGSLTIQTGEERKDSGVSEDAAVWSLSMSSEPMLSWSSFPFICSSKRTWSQNSGRVSKILTQLTRETSKLSAYKGRCRGEPKDIHSCPMVSNLSKLQCWTTEVRLRAREDGHDNNV